MNTGDVITTAEELDSLPVGTVGVVYTPGFEAQPIAYWKTGEGEWNTILVSTLLPLTVVYLPGRLPRPERVVKAEALREAAEYIKGLYATPLPPAIVHSILHAYAEAGDAL